MPRLLFSILLTAYPLFAHGQAVVESTNAVLQAQVKRDANGFSACGIRAIVMAESGNSFEANDFSMMVSHDVPYGTLKAGKTTFPVGNQKQPPVTEMPPPVQFWIANSKEGKPLLPVKLTESESPGYILGLANLVDTLKAIVSIANGERMHFAIRYKKQPYDTVVSFAAVLQQNDFDALKSCLHGVVERAK